MYQIIQKILLVGLICGCTTTSHAQRVRFSTPSTSGLPATTGQATAGATSVAPLNRNVTTLSPVLSPTTTTQLAPPPQGYAPPPQGGFTVPNSTYSGATSPLISNPNARLQAPAFDGFSTQPQTSPPPVISAPNGNLSVLPQAGAQNQIYPPPNAQPIYVPGQNFPTAPGYGGQPSSVFPGWQPSGIAWPYGSGPNGQYLRLFEDLHLKYTWINGDGGLDVDINDVQIGVTMNYPDFVRSGQPLKVTPVFVFHFWNGPGPPELTADLPSKAYSTYLQFDWSTRQDVQFGGEVEFAIGVYSDFQSVTMDSVRLTGTGLGWLRVTPNMTLKAGVEYLDRIDLKLLPAGGIFWQPNDDLNLELYFPRPKIARRLPQVGNTDMWFYVGGEYGGGSWVIERAADVSDQVDINDLRVFAGLEWTTLSAFHGFFEVGYVFERDLVYRNTALHNRSLPDSLMLRAGFSF